MSLNELTDIFRQTFDDESLELSPELGANDIENWDSFNHINLILGVENRFGVSFSTGEIQNLRTVGELVDLLNAKGRPVSW